MALVNPTRSALYLKQQITLPVPTDGFIETNTPLVVTPIFATVETNRISGAMNTGASTVDTCRASTLFTASVNMRYSGTTLTDPPEYAELLKVSGFSETIGVDTYALTNSISAIAKGSALTYMDGNKFEMTNTLVGATVINCPVGEIATVNTELSGYLDDPEPTAETNPVPALNTNPLVIVSCADVVTVDGTVIPAKEVIFSTNPEITNIYTMGGSQGYKGDEITDYSLQCTIRFPIDSANYGREAAQIESGAILAIRVVLGADDTGTPVDGESVVLLADTANSVLYADEVDNNLLQRTLTLRLYDNLPTNSALRIVTGAVSGL